MGELVFGGNQGRKGADRAQAPGDAAAISSHAASVQLSYATPLARGLSLRAEGEFGLAKGTPGGVIRILPGIRLSARKRNNDLASGSVASSCSSGTSGNCALRLSASCASQFRRFSAIHCGRASAMVL